MKIAGAAIALILMASALPAAGKIIPEQIVPKACTAGGTGCTLCHMGELVINLTNFLIYVIALPATVVLVAAGGIMLMISGASEERRTLGKKILTSTLMGVIIILLAWLAVDTIIKTLTGGSQFVQDPLGKLGPWNKLDPTDCPL